MPFFLLATVVTTGLFLVIHLAIARWVRRTFQRNLKLSRGIAAGVLVATGVVTTVHWWPLWDRTFLTVHDDPAAAWPVAVFAGHLLADLAWILLGRVFVDSRVKRDLVLHHLLGVAACVAAVALRAGYALIGVVLLAEILPVLTGLGALARTWRLENVEHWVLRTSLAAIVGFRVPLWLAIGATLVTTLAGDQAEPLHRAVAPIAFPALAAVLTLDLYWIRSYRRLLAAFPRRGVPDLSLDPLAPWFLDEATEEG